MCVDITEFVVAEDHLSPPQTPHTYHQRKVVLFLYLIKERYMVIQNFNKFLEYSLIMNSAYTYKHIMY